MNSRSVDNIAGQGTAALSPDKPLSAGKHTPGPWEYISGRPEGAPAWMSEQKFVRAPSEIVKNDRGPDYIREVFSDEDYPAKDADGRLIAAAPDLLAAARRALNVLKATGESVRPGNALGALEAAIAKASAQ